MALFAWRSLNIYCKSRYLNFRENLYFASVTVIQVQPFLTVFPRAVLSRIKEAFFLKMVKLKQPSRMQNNRFFNNSLSDFLNWYSRSFMSKNFLKKKGFDGNLNDIFCGQLIYSQRLGYIAFILNFKYSLGP